MSLSPVSPEVIAGIWHESLRGIDNYSFYVATPDLVVEFDAERVFSGASMVKTFLLHVVSDQVRLGNLSWAESVTVDAQHCAQGDGLIRHWPLPQNLTLLQASGLMIAVSDNVATNAIVDHLGGTERANDLISSLGYEKSSLRSWVGGRHRDPRRDTWTVSDGLINAAGLSVVTAREHAECVRAVMADDVCAGLLAGQNDRRSLSRHLAEGVDFAHKTGTVDGLRHDGGRFVLDGSDYLDVHVFTDGPSRDEAVDDYACRAMGRGMRETLRAFGLGSMTLAD